MISFEDIPSCSMLGDGSFMIDEDFNYQFISAKITVVFPKGTIYNGSSTPRLLTPVFPRYGNGMDIPALIHDLSYSTGIVSRKEADLEFRFLLKECGIGLIRRSIIYRAVRLFGGGHYNRQDYNVTTGSRF